MTETSKTYTVTSKSFGRNFGKFHAQKNMDKYTVYNGAGEQLGRFNSMADAEKVAENLAYKRLEVLKIRLNDKQSATSADKLFSEESFIAKNLTCMIGGFYIVNSRPTEKCFYLAYEKQAEIKYIYPTYEAAFADLINLFKVKDLEVLIS
jgi:hypothetical protein